MVPPLRFLHDFQCVTSKQTAVWVLALGSWILNSDLGSETWTGPWSGTQGRPKYSGSMGLGPYTGDPQTETLDRGWILALCPGTARPGPMMVNYLDSFRISLKSK